MDSRETWDRKIGFVGDIVTQLGDRETESWASNEEDSRIIREVSYKCIFNFFVKIFQALLLGHIHLQLLDSILIPAIMISFNVTMVIV